MASQTNPLTEMIEAACEAAIKRAMRISDVSRRRLLTTKEAAAYLTLCEREIYNMIASRQLASVRHGKRLMIDIHDLEQWIKDRKDV
jgi:excisionase family DNA binding protein